VIDVGREVHGRVRPRAPRERHDRLQAAAALADLLLIDDVQFIAGKESTQEEFFHTMNEIITAGKRLVITSDRAPQDLDGIAPRILSRLSWGLVADINAADLELRFNIMLKKLALLPGVKMPRTWSTSSPSG
jgi:chromosomal replication initiator protein